VAVGAPLLVLYSLTFFYSPIVIASPSVDAAVFVLSLLQRRALIFKSPTAGWSRSEVMIIRSNVFFDGII